MNNEAAVAQHQQNLSAVRAPNAVLVLAWDQYIHGRSPVFGDKYIWAGAQNDDDVRRGDTVIFQYWLTEKRAEGMPLFVVVNERNGFIFATIETSLCH